MRQGRREMIWPMTESPRIKLIAPAASPEEATAITVALERFIAEHESQPAPVAAREGGWSRSALLAGVGASERPDAWGDSHPWGNT